MDQVQLHGLNVPQLQARAPLVAYLYFARVQLFGMTGDSLNGCQTEIVVISGCACYLKNRVVL